MKVKTNRFYDNSLHSLLDRMESIIEIRLKAGQTIISTNVVAITPDAAFFGVIFYQEAK